MIYSKENVTKLPQNSKIPTELEGRRQGEGSGFLSFWFSWDHWHAMRWFLWPSQWVAVPNKKSFSTASIMNHPMCWKGPLIPCSSSSLPWAETPSTTKVLKTPSSLALTTSTYKGSTASLGKITSASPIYTILMLLSWHLYSQSFIFRILKFCFQILVAPLARHLDRKKGKFWILLDIHIYPQAVI